MPAFTHRGRVAFHETDAAGIVHFSNYFCYAEEAETAALASLGIFSAETLRHYSFPRAQAGAQYSAPLHFGDEFEVRAALTRIGNSSLTWSFEVVRAETLCARVELVSVRVNLGGGRPAPYSDEEKAALKKLLHPAANADADGKK